MARIERIKDDILRALNGVRKSKSFLVPRIV